MRLSSIENIDALFAYIYSKGSTYIKYRDIVSEHFKGDEINNDIEGMLIKLKKDGFVDFGTHDNGKSLGWTKQTIYKLSFEGRLLYETAKQNKPYTQIERDKRNKNAWGIVKIVAAVINAVLVILVAIWAGIQSSQIGK